MSNDTEDHSHIDIKALHISDEDKKRLLDSVSTTELGFIAHIFTVQASLSRAVLENNLQGVVELLEYKRTLMQNPVAEGIFTERDLIENAERIKAIATLLHEQQRQARLDAETARKNAIPLLLEERPRANRRRRSKSWG